MTLELRKWVGDVRSRRRRELQKAGVLASLFIALKTELSWKGPVECQNNTSDADWSAIEVIFGFLEAL